MDFDEVVGRAKELHTQGRFLPEPEEGLALSETVYGRICTSQSAGPPVKMAASANRKTVFVFNGDAIESIILRMNAYDALLKLGFDKPYIRYKVVEKKCTFWLFLFKPTAARCHDNDFCVARATWDGVKQIVRVYYPEVYPHIMEHEQELRTNRLEYFESQAGFEFLESRRNEDGSVPNGHPYFSYDYFCKLPVGPRKVWEIRLFLYCELRLLKFFEGDGYTRDELGRRGCQEYFCSNAALSVFDPTESALIPMDVTIPE